MGFGYSLLYSFGVIGLMNSGFTMEHWLKLVQNNDALSSLIYAAFIAFFSIVFTLIPALFFAYLLSFYKGENFLKKTMLIPLLIAPIIAGFLGYYILSPTGIIARIAALLGLLSSPDAFPSLVNDNFSIGIFLTHLFLLFPLFTFLFLHLLKKERIVELKNISTTLGATSSSFIVKIFIPLVLNKSKIIIVLYGLFVFGAYEIPLILGRQSPRMVSIFITEKLTKFNLNDIAVGHAMAVVYTLIVFSFITIVLRKKNKNFIPF